MSNKQMDAPQSNAGSGTPLPWSAPTARFYGIEVVENAPNPGNFGGDGGGFPNSCNS